MVICFCYFLKNEYTITTIVIPCFYLQKYSIFFQVINCVGFRNYKYFCLFCFYTCLAGALFLFCTFTSSFTAITSPFTSSSELELSVGSGFALMLCSVMTLAFALSLLFFVGFHGRLVAYNQTTIEFSDRVPSQRYYIKNVLILIADSHFS